MFLKKVILRNWANLPDGEYEPGPLTLITGGNGAGKTTLGDAIQSVLTATKNGLFRYNPGQDESSQQSRNKTHRTLGSYILGCDDQAFSRPHLTDGYVALCWQPDDGEQGWPFTAVLGARAQVVKAGEVRRAELTRLDLYVLPKRHLALQDFKNENQDAWLDLEKEFRKVMISRYGKKSVEYFNHKEAYLCRLYGLFKGMETGSVNTTEMKQSVKAFVKFMAYKPVNNLDQFVCDSILEEVDNTQAITQVSSMMKSITNMRQDAEHISGCIGTVGDGLENTKSFIDQWLKRQESLALKDMLDSRYKQKEYLKTKQREQDLKHQIQDVDDQLLRIQQELKSLDRQRLDLASRCHGNDAYRSKQELDEEVAQSQRVISQAAVETLQSIEPVEDIKHQALEILSFLQNHKDHDWYKKIKGTQSNVKGVLAAFESLPDLGDILKQAQPEYDSLVTATQRWQQLERALETLHQQLHQSEKGHSIITQLSFACQLVSSKAQDAKQTVSEKSIEISQLTQHQKVSYPNSVRRALDLIRQRIPNANPRVVGDHIEVLDETWQNAIEGYLGGARFNIVVDPECEAQAIKLVRKEAGNVKVVQGKKSLADSKKLVMPETSILHLMSFDDRYVQAYIEASYGPVVQVENAEALRKTARGLTANGMGSGGYSMFKSFVEDGDLVCGQAARERRTSALEREQERLARAAKDAQEKANVLVVLNKNLLSLQPIQVNEPLTRLLEHLAKTNDIANQLDDIDLSEIEEVQAKLDEVVETFNLRQEENNRLQQQRGQLLNEWQGSSDEKNKHRDNEGIKAKLKRLAEDREHSQELAEERLNQYLSWYLQVKDGNRDELYEAYWEQANEADEVSQHEILMELSKTTTLNARMNRIRDAIAKYNQTPVQSNRVKSYFEDVLDEDIDAPIYLTAAQRTLKDIEILHQRLRNHILVQQQDILQSAQHQFDSTFTTHLVQHILNNLADAERTLERLNKELKFHKFDDETYSFTLELRKEYKDYVACFKEMVAVHALASNGSGSLFENESLSKKARGVLDSIKSLLLSDNDEKSRRDLERLSDYRNYYRYDILKKPEAKEPIPLSTYGTGSGGQLETPFYVIMAAAFQAALRFQEGSCHMKTVLIDESFSKLDEKRSRRILEYLSQKLGLQVLFIMPTLKSGPFKAVCTNQIVVQKVDDLSPPKRSELKTRVLVDQQVINRDAIATLLENHRVNVRQQVEMEFLNLIEEVE